MIQNQGQSNDWIKPYSELTLIRSSLSTTVFLLVILVVSMPIVYAYVYEQQSQSIGQTIINVLTNLEDYVDNNTSDVDSSADKGTHSNFTAQQYGPDSILDTLTEENTMYASVRSKSWSAETSATQNHEVLLPPTIESGDTILVFFVNDDNEVTNFPGGWTEIYNEDVGSAGPTMVVAWKEAVGDEDGTSITVTTGSTEHSVHVAWAIQDADDPDNNPPEVSLESAGNDAYPDALSLSPSGGSKPYLWISVSGNDDGRSLVTTYPSNMNDNNEVHTSHFSNFGVAIGLATNSSLGSAFNPANFVLEDVELWEACTVGVYPAGSANYNLDLEVQWTNVDYNQPNEELCIYGGTMGTEDISVDVWDGAVWQNVFTDLAIGWNNVTVSSYLTSSTFTIRFKGATESNDVSQDSWNIDVTMLHVWES